jgi:AcrR family transcriptional regulator
LTPAASSRRGRPRSVEADEAILNATMELLAEVGFTGMSMDEVARRAGVGKDTLYRRHKSKVELVRNVIGRLSEEEIRIPHTGSYEEDVRTYIRSVVRLLSKSDVGLVVAGLVGEAARNPELAQAFRAFWKGRRETAKEVLLPPSQDDRRTTHLDQEVLIDLVLGAIHHRLLISGATLGPRFVDELVDAVTGTLVSSRKAERMRSRGQ